MQSLRSHEARTAAGKEAVSATLTDTEVLTGTEIERGTETEIGTEMAIEIVMATDTELGIDILTHQRTEIENRMEGDGRGREVDRGSAHEDNALPCTLVTEVSACSHSI